MGCACAKQSEAEVKPVQQGETSAYPALKALNAEQGEKKDGKGDGLSALLNSAKATELEPGEKPAAANPLTSEATETKQQPELLIADVEGQSPKQTRVPEEDTAIPAQPQAVP